MSINVTPIPRLIDLAAPAFTLGTSNVAGNAVTAIASNSTLLTFDGTDPAAVASSAAVGSATVASRRDHVHSGSVTTLSNYEEGVWTPTFADHSLDGTGEGQVYSVQLGNYTKIGRVVYFSFSCTISNLGTMVTSQNVSVMGLPYPSKNVGQYSATASVSQMDSAAITALSSPTGAITPNVSHIQLFQFNQTTGIAILTVAQLSAGGSVRASGFYIT